MYRNIDEIKRMQELINYGAKAPSKPSGAIVPIVEFSQKAADGNVYGILRECNKYYIKVAHPKDEGVKILAEDYEYINGFNSRKENEYSSYPLAAKQFDMKIISINEAHKKKVRLEQAKPVEQADWQVNETREMREEINRFNEINGNVKSILGESNDGITMAHTVPEAPATNPSEKKVNNPYTDTAVAKGDKDMNAKETNHEKAGTPYDKDGEVSNKDMQSDKKASGNTDATYTEKAKYVPDGAVADKHPSGGKAVKVNESGRVFRLTEDQVLAWNRNFNYMDKSHGTQVGSSTPFTDELGKESNQTEADTDPIREGETVHDTDNQNVPTPGTNKVGSTAPFDKKVNESPAPVSDVAGMPDDDDDVPFPEVEKGGSDYDPIANNNWLDDHSEGEGDNDDDDEYEFDVEDMEDGIPTDTDFWESVRRIASRKVNEEVMNDFGKHPAYRKVPMTTLPNKEVAPDWTRDWDDESAKGEEPFGKRIGSSSPYNELVKMITDAIVSKANFREKA